MICGIDSSKFIVGHSYRWRKFCSNGWSISMLNSFEANHIQTVLEVGEIFPNGTQSILFDKLNTLACYTRKDFIDVSSHLTLSQDQRINRTIRDLKPFVMDESHIDPWPATIHHTGDRASGKSNLVILLAKHIASMHLQKKLFDEVIKTDNEWESFNKDNLLEAKKQVELQRNTKEVAEAKAILTNLLDAKDSLTRQIKDKQDQLVEIEKKLKLFTRK